MRSFQLIVCLGITVPFGLGQLSLEYRDNAAATGPSGICPEVYGNEPMFCDDPSCGGKDDSGSVCKSRNSAGQNCQCKDAASTVAPSTPKTTVVTVTSSGSTIVGTWELQTLTSYTSLKQEATITVTTTGTSGAETALAVVAAGGVAWFLGYTGEAEAASALTAETPAAPEDEPDDPTCPAEHDKCSDCGGTAGFCTTKNPGCACDEEKQCPTSDQEPECSDDSCKGQDDKCTTGDNQGCACNSGPQCPDERYKPYCDFCGNKGNDGKCNGLSDKNGLWKGCDCMDNPEEDEAWPSPLQTALDFDPDTLPDESMDTYSYSGDNPISCQNLGWGADRDDLHKSINDWCKSNDQKQLNKAPGIDTIFNRVAYSYYSYWLAATFDDSNGGCGTSSTVDEQKCHSTMQEMLGFCDVDKTTFNGATLIDECTRYTVTFSTSTKDDDPPWNPLPQAQQSPNCPDKNIETSDIPFYFWEGVAETYCSHQDSHQGSFKETLTNKDFQEASDSKRSIVFRRTPPPNPNSYDGYTFDFDFEQNDSDTQCLKDCTTAMQSFSAACGHLGNQQNAMQASATFDNRCGTYSYKINPPPPKVPFQPVCMAHIYIYPPIIPIPDDILLKDIPTPDSNLIAPMCTYFGDENTSIKGDQAADHYAYGHSGDYAVYLNYRYWDNGGSCKDKQSAPQPFSQDDCKTALASIFPLCDNVGGGEVIYKCLQYEYWFTKWDDQLADKQNVNL